MLCFNILCESLYRSNLGPLDYIKIKVRVALIILYFKYIKSLHLYSFLYYIKKKAFIFGDL